MKSLFPKTTATYMCKLCKQNTVEYFAEELKYLCPECGCIDDESPLVRAFCKVVPRNHITYDRKEYFMKRVSLLSGCTPSLHATTIREHFSKLNGVLFWKEIADELKFMGLRPDLISMPSIFNLGGSRIIPTCVIQTSYTYKLKLEFVLAAFLYASGEDYSWVPLPFTKTTINNYWKKLKKVYKDWDDLPPMLVKQVRLVTKR